MATTKGTGKPKEKTQEIVSGERTERIIASGEKLTIETIGDLARKIEQGMAEAETVVIDFPETVEADITALQLFCSACLAAVASKKQFIHRGTLPQALLDLAAAVGSERKEHCRNNNISCFRKFGGMV